MRGFYGNYGTFIAIQPETENKLFLMHENSTSKPIDFSLTRKYTSLVYFKRFVPLSYINYCNIIDQSMRFLISLR